MNTIDTTPEAAEDALVRLARHIPPDVEIGRPLAASVTEDDTAVFVTTEAFWWADNGHSSRLVDLGDGYAELTEFAYGIETACSIAPMH